MGRPRKNKGLRAPKAVAPGVDVDFDELDEDDELPAAGGDASASDPARPRRKRLPFDEFCRFVAGYPDKTGVTFYLYRVWPKINLEQVGVTPKYIDKMTVFDLGAVRVKWGSGKYRVCFTDSNRPGDARVCESYFDIEDSELAPAFEHDYRELDLGHPENVSFVQTLRIKKLLPGEKDMQTGGALETAVNKLAELATDKGKPAVSADEKAFDQALKLAALLQPKSDPYELALKIAAATKQDSGQSSLVSSLLDQNQKLMALMMEHRQAPAAPAAAADPLEQVERWSKLSRFFGGGARNAGPDWSWLSDVAKSLAPFLVPFLLSKVGPGAAAGPGGPVVNLPMPAAAATDGAAPGGENPMFRLLVIGQKALKAFDKGVSGDDFASGLVAMEDDGAEIYTALFELGEVGILAALKSSPQWASVATREAQVTQFVRDFLEYGKPENGEGGQS